MSGKIDCLNLAQGGMGLSGGARCSITSNFPIEDRPRRGERYWGDLLNNAVNKGKLKAMRHPLGNYVECEVSLYRRDVRLCYKVRVVQAEGGMKWETFKRMARSDWRKITNPLTIDRIPEMKQLLLRKMSDRLPF